MSFLLIMAVLAFLCVVYVNANPLRRSGVILFAVSFSMVFFLSRFNSLATVWMGQYPLAGIHLYQIFLLLFLGIILALNNRSFSRTAILPLPFLLTYAFFSLVSGVVNAGLEGALASFQILLISLTPALLAWVLLELARNQAGEPANLRKTYILPLGVVTPIILLVSAMLPDVFGSVLGWGPTPNFGGDEGFLRGWSPMGSTILTGSLVVIAYGFALHEAVANRSRLHLYIAVLASASVLFTASRAVMLVFVIFNLIYWPLVGKWRTFARVASLPAMVLLLILGWSVMSGSFSFGRFLVVKDQSTTLRASSALVAVDLAKERPVLGHGPGQVYPEIRTLWIANPSRQAKMTQRAVGQRATAMEPHNLYLYLLAEHGIFATLAFVAAMLVGFFAVWRQRPPRGDLVDRSERAVFIGLWAGLVFIFVTASWLLINPQYSLFFWLFVFGALHTVESRRKDVVL